MAAPEGSETGIDGAGEETSQYRCESSGTVNTLTKQIAEVYLNHPPPTPPLPQPSNWESVLNSLKLYVDAESFTGVMVKDSVTGENEMRPCYDLEDLWKSFNVPSIYGAGVPLMWGEDSITQYFVPTLSGMQLYVDSSDPQTWLRAREKSRAEMPEKDVTGEMCTDGADNESITSFLSSSTAEAESPRKSNIDGRSVDAADMESVISVLSSESESSRESDTGRSSGADEADITAISSPTAKDESSRKNHTGGRNGAGKADTPAISSSTAEAESLRKIHTGETEVESSRKADTSCTIESASKELDTHLLTTEALPSRNIHITEFEADKESCSSLVISSITVEDYGCNSRGMLLLEHLDPQLPFNRLPLTDQIASIYKAFGLPELPTLTSIDLLPSSWIAVAWYPAYKVPSGLTLRDLDTAFLTFHFLSTRAKCNPPHEVNEAPDTPFGPGGDALRLSIPLFGLASYKMQGSIVAPTEPHEIAQENSLFFAADAWLRSLNVYLKDFGFFRSQFYRRR